MSAPDRDTHALGPADWLGLAAAPTFALMAVLTSLSGGGGMAAICGAEPSPLGGMIPMYLLMSGFHAAPWLRLFARRQGRVRPRAPWARGGAGR
jgi:hypothetical protein